MSNSIRIQSITAVQTLPLRSAVLRPDRPIEESIFVGDNDPATFHLGAFADDALIGVASLYREPLRGSVAQVAAPAVQPADVWRLRGMAVEPMLQGQGYGRQLLTACLQEVGLRDGKLLWCNARTSAVGFYQGAGFEISGAEFVIPQIGPHYVMLRCVEKSR